MLRFRFVFDDTIHAVDLELGKFLHGPASRPLYGQALNASRLAETDFLLQAGPAKGTAVAHNPVNLPFPVIAPGFDDDSRTHAEPVRLDANQPQCHPVSVVAGVFKQHVTESIAGVKSAQLMEQVLVSVIVQVTERHSVTLLDVPEPATKSNIGKFPAFFVTVHGVRYLRLEGRFTGAEVEIQPAVIIDIAVVGSHRQVRSIETQRLTRLLEFAAPVQVNERCAGRHLRTKV